MRALSTLLLISGVAGGSLATLTAYLPRLEAVERLAVHAPLTLGAVAGRREDADGKPVPIALVGEKLTVEVTTRLRTAGVERVRVREFAWARWTHGWLFGLASAALVAGGLLVRRESASGRAEEAERGYVAPEVSLAAMRARLREICLELPALRASGNAGDEITRRLGDLQATHLDAFAAARNTLLRSIGQGGFAAVMGRFSVFERQVNRAWSSAADGHLDEAAACLARADERLAELEEVWSALTQSRRR
jgi:hypothetical protein